MLINANASTRICITTCRRNGQRPWLGIVE
jgi:hypothetical protein